MNNKEKNSLYIDESYSIPVWTINGVNKGKTLVITAGVHGCEYVGMLTAQKLFNNITPSDVSGRIIILPLVNISGFYKCEKQIFPQDNKNLNRLFPSYGDGTISEKTAHIIEKEIFPLADCLIDLHGGDINEAMNPLVFFSKVASADIIEKSRECAKQLHVDTRVASTSKNGLYSYASMCGIPSMLLEIGGNGKWSEFEITKCENSIYSLADYLGILSNQTPYSLIQKEATKAIYEESNFNGFWYPSIHPGEKVVKGQLLGEIKDIDEQILQKIYAEFDSFILYHTTSLGISKSDALVAYCIYE